MDAEFLLIPKMKRGEEQAFDQFVRKHYEEILRYCRYHCPDASYAEDLAQETFFRFFAKLSDYRHMGKVRNFLYTIAGNLCRDYYKKVKECSLEELPEELQDRRGSAEFSSVSDRREGVWLRSGSLRIYS